MQRPFAPAAGFLSAVPVERYPAFPASPLKRIEWAMSAPLSTPSHKTVLIVLSYRADEGGKAWPSFDSIAESTALSRRQVIETIKALEDLGWISVYRRTRRSSLYFPKRPGDQHCPECWILLPAKTQLCPACGQEPRVHSLHQLVK